MILLQCKIQESDTTDFQVEDLYLTSNGIPKKRDKDARLLAGYQAVR